MDFLKLQLQLEHILFSVWNNLPFTAREQISIENYASMLMDIANITSLRGEIETNIEAEQLQVLVKQFLKNQAVIAKLRDIPHVPQRSEEWLNLRKNMLTASDLAQSIGKGKFGSRTALLQKKALALCTKYNKSGMGDDNLGSISSTPAPAIGLPIQMMPLKWGTMFEPMISRVYSERHGNIEIYEFGLLKHPSIPHFGASPDGITSSGRMVEIKCPWRRKIEQGTVPEQYMLQIQGQLSVCNLDVCDYFEVIMDDISSEGEYYMMVSETATTEHGVIIEIQLPTGQETYEYSPPHLTPKQAYEWAKGRAWQLIEKNQDVHILKIRPWKVQASNMVSVAFNPELWNTLVPQINTFWKDVLALRDKYDASVTDETIEKEISAMNAPSIKRVKKNKPVCNYRDDEDDNESNPIL